MTTPPMSEDHRRAVSEAIATELCWYPAPSESAKQERNARILKSRRRGICRRSPLIAAEMARVARDYDTGGYGMNRNMVIAQTVSEEIALAILSHAEAK